MNLERKNFRGGEIFAIRAKLLPPSDQNPVYAPGYRHTNLLTSCVLCNVLYVLYRIHVLIICSTIRASVKC